MNRDKPIAYSLFAGAGGFDLGIERAGFNVVVATDIEKSCEETHALNWPEKPFLSQDIMKISAKHLTSLAKGMKPDLIIGGPPCQGFSTLGDKLSSDPRNRLFYEYARLVSELNPPCILIENVKAFVTMYGGQYRNYLIKAFSALGYTMYEAILNAADYGVPQVRHRAIFFGTKINKPFAFPKPTHGLGHKLKKYETVGKWIMDLAPHSNGIPNHIVLNHSETVIERYKLIPEGGRLPSPENLPAEIRRKNFGNTYKRLHRLKPALTLVPGNNAFPIHPTKHRSLTPREAARLQSFPDDFMFSGDRRSQCILVGNAVPPLLAQALGKSVLNHIQGKISAIEATKQADPLTSQARTKNAILVPSNKLSEEFSFIDLFSGAGGFTIGFSRADWKPVLSVDLNPFVENTHKFNFPSFSFLRADISQKKTKQAIYAQCKDKEIGLVVGGPPCQGFSIFGKRRFVNTRGYDPHKDSRNKLVFSYVDIVKNLSPRWLVMENVPGFANLDGGYFLETVLQEFKKIGYKNCEARILNAADYGVPQIRKRLLIIGNRTGHIIPWPKKKFFGNPEDWQENYRTVGEVISDLATHQALKLHTCHIPMNHKPLLVERYKLIREGMRLDADSLPKPLQRGYRTDKVKNFSHVFKRLNRNKPSSTLVPGHNAFPIHPWLHRALTVREAARIQTFPDEIEFKGPRQEQCIQVGNAFPPLLAELIANNIRKAEINRWFPGKVPSSAYYSLVELSKDVGIPSYNEKRHLVRV